MAAPLVSDSLWQRIEPLLPPPKPRRPDHPGRKPLDRRKVLAGIIFVLKTGIPWEDLPCEMGCGCGMSCWNYLRAWQEAGVWQHLHEVLLQELQDAEKLDWSRAAIDSTKARADGGGEETGPNPTDRSKPGTKHHVLTDAQGIPLATDLTGANTPDVNHLLPLVDAVPEITDETGQPQQPEKVYADRGYDSAANRQALEDRGIEPKIAQRGTEHGSGLGVYRWVVERTEAWLHNFGRLRHRTDRDSEIHNAFLNLGAALICMWFIA